MNGDQSSRTPEERSLEIIREQSDRIVALQDAYITLEAENKRLNERLRAASETAATLPRYLVYDVDKHQSSPHFTDNPSEHNGAPGECDVLVDLHTGRRKWEGQWEDISVARPHAAPQAAETVTLCACPRRSDCEEAGECLRAMKVIP